MIKKILVTLFIFILIIAIGIVSLIVFVDPNNFRGFISDTVKDKTGYELTIEGDLRWHIWPQISILTDSVKLYDTGAQKPILLADNMRLDVELFPLFSKKLAVKNILVKSAVINITDESKGQISKNKEENSANINSNQLPKPKDRKSSSNWTFTLNKLEVADSTIVLQHNEDIINFRNLNLTVEQDDNQKVSVDLKGNIDRNQQDLSYLANADIDLTQYPEKVKIALNKFNYTYKGITVPTGELQGSMNGVFDYQQNPQVLKSQNVKFSVNDNTFTGNINLKLDKKPYAELELKSDKVDFTPFITSKEKSSENVTIQQTTPAVSPVAKTSNELSFLNGFNAKTKLNIKELVANKIVLNNIHADIVNDEGIATFKDISFDLAKGHITTTGSANGKQKNALIKLNTKINDVDLNTFFSEIEVSKDLEGLFNASGNVEVNTITASKLLESLQGNLAITITNARLDNINIPSIIEEAASKYTKDISTPDSQKRYTEFQKIEANASLNKGDLDLTSLTATSPLLEVVESSGKVGMIERDLDVNLNVKMLGGWNGKNETIAKLQQLVIPLHIYGKFANLHYQIDLGKIIKDLFNDKWQQSLDNLRNKLENQDPNDDSKKSKNKQKAAKILGEILKR
ncbi:hypothetical protein A9G11_11675 [Gilliamella sp. wkB108]|uniref:outer membrane assembly protein AsmA n=1 Tax=Gilliamella sp. wkB108 TaxID=3120256 RepID=UPI00080DD279|nr:outer membrane assembly protein AsmA [Gilliamella apicola]OCG28160.1 hypothetical protein A9G11_11675 [Gilliamella apicola]